MDPELLAQAQQQALQFLTETATIFNPTNIPATDEPMGGDGEGGLSPTAGGGTLGFLEGPSYPCRRVIKSGSREGEAGERLSSVSALDLVLPFNANVTTSDRVKVGDTIYEIITADIATDMITRHFDIEEVK